MMIDNEIIKALEDVRYHLTASKHKEVIDDAIDVINRLQAGVENQSQNFKVLVSDHRCLQLSFDNLKGLYQAEKEKVESAKSKSIYFAKKFQKARAEIERLQNLTEKDFEQTAISTVKRHQKWIEYRAIKEFAERLCKGRVSNDPVVIAVKAELKEMVGDTE